MAAKLNIDGGDEVELRGPIRDEMKSPTEEEIAACRPCRLVLIVFFSLGLLAMLVAAIVVIATTSGCATLKVRPVKPFWQNDSSYEIYVHSFKDTNDDGYGDVKGITENLNYLEEIGVRILVLNGLTGTEFNRLHTRSGSMADFEDLITKAKNRKMNIVLDFNPTFTANDSSWFIDSSSSNSSRYRDWYIWSMQPNNWDNKAGVSAWKLDRKTNQYYYYYIDEKKPGLNYSNPLVKNMLIDSLKFWLKKGVKGFKLNDVRRLIVDGQLRSNVPGKAFDKDLAEVHSLLNELHDVVKGYDAFLMATINDDSKVASYYGTKEKPELDIALNNKIAGTLPGTPGVVLNQTIESYLNSVPRDIGWPGWIFGGTQYKRLAERFSDPRLLRLWAICLLTLPGNPVVYYGDEVNLKDSSGKSTTAMAWNSKDNGGFSKVNPWYSPGAKITPTTNVEAQKKQKGTYHVFTEVSKLRLNEIALQSRNITVLYQSADVIVYQRYQDKKAGLVIALNFGTSEQQTTPNLPTTIKWKVVVDSIDTLKDRELTLKILKLAPFQGLVLKVKE